jgi:hypothetical protein
MRLFDKSVDECGFAMVNVSNDRNISDVLHVILASLREKLISSYYTLWGSILLPAELAGEFD